MSSILKWIIVMTRQGKKLKIKNYKLGKNSIDCLEASNFFLIKWLRDIYEVN